MIGLGIPELLISLAIVLVLFGPGRLSGMGSAIGQSIRSFREAVREPTAQGSDRDARPPPCGAPRADHTDRTV